MDLDALEMVTGAALLGIGLLAGRRNRAPRKPDKQSYICGCDHELAFHDPSTGECHGKVRGNPLKYDTFREPTAWEQVQCSCRQYDGPPNLDNVNWAKVNLPTLPGKDD
jgi:hypothetical protein